MRNCQVFDMIALAGTISVATVLGQCARGRMKTVLVLPRARERTQVIGSAQAGSLTCGHRHRPPPAPALLHHCCFHPPTYPTLFVYTLLSS